MKKFVTKTIVLMAGFMMATTAFAASTNDDPSFNTMYTTDAQLTANQWGSSVSVQAGDKVSFELHYYLKSGVSANNMRFSMEDLTGRTFEAGSSETVTGKIAASNLTTSNGSVVMNTTERVKLNLYNVSWQKYPCQSVGCEENLVDSYSKVLTSGGMSIGNVAGYTGNNWQGAHYTGNVIITFKVVAVDNNYQNCTFNGSTVAHGSSVNAYANSSVAYGSSCSTQTRTCNNGTLSGSYSYSSCSVGNPNNGGDEAEVETNSATNVDDDSAVLRGEVTMGDNVDVYFVYSRTDTTPECKNSNDTIVSVSGDQDAGDSFSKTVNGLIENERYYYRACGIGEDGETDEGSVREFVTDQEGNNGGDRDADVRTNSATNVDEDSAVLRGEVRDGDNVDVYFVLSSTDTTPECKNTNDRLINVSGSRDDGDDFSRTVTNLNDNTRYYYRACGVGLDGEVDDGNVVEFVTDQDDDDNNNNNPSTGGNPYTLTSTASGITTTRATLNSYVFGEGTGTCYFQYGRGTSLGLTTNRTFVDLDRTTRCGSSISGLIPGETYFYRSVLVLDGETYYGSTRSFRTDRVVTNPRPPVTPTTPRPTVPGTNVNVNINVDEQIEDGQCLQLTKWVSGETDSRFDEFTRADNGDNVYYKVRLTNVCNDTVENILLIDRIPFYLELDEERSLNDDDEKTVGWTIERLSPGQSRTYITEMTLRDDAIEGDQIISYATASWDDGSVNSNDVTIEVDEDTVTGGQTASIFGAGFWPTTLFGWLLLILIVLAIIYFVSRILAARNENARTLAELRAAQAARNNS